MSSPLFRSWFAAFVLGWLGVSAVTIQAATNPPPSASPAPSAATASPSPTAPAALALADIAPQSESALGTLKAIEPDDTPGKETTEVRELLPEFSDRASQLLIQGIKATVGTSVSLDTLRDIQGGWTKLQTDLKARSELLNQRGTALADEQKQIDTLQTQWTATAAAIRPKDANVPPETSALVGDVLAAIREARQRIKVRQTSLLDLQARVGDLNGKVRDGLAGAEKASADAVKTLFVRDSPPVWAAQARPAPDLAGRWGASYAGQFGDLQSYVRTHGDLLAIHGAIFLVLLALLFWLRRGLHAWTEQEPHLKRAAPIFQVPIATALALSFLLKGPLYAGAPSLFRALLGVAVLLPTVVILRRLLDRRLYFILYALIVFFCLDLVRVATATLPALNRWIFLGEMAGGALVFLLLTRAQSVIDPRARAFLGRWFPVLMALAVATLAAALGATAFGYVRLGTLVGTAVLTSAYVAVFLYALLRVIEGLTLIALRLPPASSSRIAQTHREPVQRNVYSLFRAAALAFWVYFTLSRLQVWSPLYGWTRDALAKEHGYGSFNLTLGSLLSFALAIWVSLLVSRVLRFFLDEEVYERVHLSAGLPYAISTMLNYLILLVGFIVALGLLGVDLTKITIVAGAFSVGLGFGLQNIINNFVSGIILLFERPVKVGDVIQIGDAVGEVRRIGIRASIVRTRDGSDVILPNGNLISNQVTNWTYADRCRAVEIPFNIAAGPDPSHVLELLRTTAVGSPATDDRPAPSVYITAITAGGLSVVVRAWTTHYEDWIQVRSDLSVALVAAMTKENIKLV